MSLWELLNDQKEEMEEEVKSKEAPTKSEKEITENEVKEETKQAKADEKLKKTAKKTNKTTKKKAAEKKEEKSKSGYTYPFGLYTEGRMVDISSYGFEDGKTYEDKEITKIMLNHRHYEFAGDIEYNFIKDDNVLVANLKQHKKG